MPDVEGRPVNVDRPTPACRAMAATVYDRRPCNDPPMATAVRTPRLRAARLARHRAALPAVAPATLELGLTIPELEEALMAIGDREDLVGDPNRRARLARARAALERELGRALDR